MTFKRVGDEVRSLWKDLSDEFYLTNLEIRAGMPREESYKNMSRRTGVSEVQSLMGMLIQTSKFGTSVSAALRVHSAGMRMKRRQLAEEKAAQIGGQNDPAACHIYFSGSFYRSGRACRNYNFQDIAAGNARGRLKQQL
jgi:hypothetical protein